MGNPTFGEKFPKKGVFRVKKGVFQFYRGLGLFVSFSKLGDRDRKGFREITQCGKGSKEGLVAIFCVPRSFPHRGSSPLKGGNMAREA